MAHPEEIRLAVRKSYISDRLPIEQAARVNGLPVATVRRWKREAKGRSDDWDKIRDAMLIAGGGFEDVVRQTLVAIILQTQTTIDEISEKPDISPIDKVQMLASLSDSHAKLVASNRRMMPKTDRLAVSLDVLKRLREFCRHHAPQHAAALADMLEAFGRELVKDNG